MKNSEGIRLNKFISECGIASRRKADELISQGRVSVNGVTVTKLGIVVNPANDKVKVDGESIREEKKVYFLLNKPKGYITTTKDEKNRPNVTELIKTNAAIFPVGRLDFNTTGVLILTNDGEFAQDLTHPGNKVPRIYDVTLNYPLTPENRERLLKGINLDRRKSKFETVEFNVKNNPAKVEVTTTEGRNHFVKRMFEAVGLKVYGLERAAFGPFTLSSIPPGKYIEIKPEEIFDIMNEYSR